MAFINGADAATDGALLRGLRPWLAARLGSGPNLVWWRLVQNIHSAETSGPSDVPVDNEQLCSRMFSLLIEYLTNNAT